MRFYKDTTGELERIANDLIGGKKELRNLKHINLLFLWRDGLKKKGSKVIQGMASKLPPKTRDLYGYDASIEICSNSWVAMSNKDKRKLVYHELKHIEVETEEDGLTLKEDKEGRIKIKLVEHDVDLQRFSSELGCYGLSLEEESVRQYLNDVHDKYKDKKPKKDKTKIKKKDKAKEKTKPKKDKEGKSKKKKKKTKE